MRKISSNIAARLARKYPLSVRWSDEDQVSVGSIPGNCCHGDTPEEAIPQLKYIADDLVTYLVQKNKLPPSPLIKSSNPDTAAIRSVMGTSKTRSAQLIGASVRTPHKWEQHTCNPSGAAKTLLKIAASHPQAVRQALGAV